MVLKKKLTSSRLRFEAEVSMARLQLRRCLFQNLWKPCLEKVGVRLVARELRSEVEGGSRVRGAREVEQGEGRGVSRVRWQAPALYGEIEESKRG
jgi:hypothetical protein